MKTVVVTLKSVSPITFGRYHKTDKLDRELHAAYEERTWRERAHFNEAGQVTIPPMMLKNSLDDAVAFMGTQIPGRGKERYRKHFESGVMVMEPIVLPVKKDDLLPDWVFVPADGKAGGTKRVEKCFPMVRDWTGEATYYVLDEIITEDVFVEHLRACGQFIGMGTFRPQKRGYHGRFDVLKIKWS